MLIGVEIILGLIDITSIFPLFSTLKDLEKKSLKTFVAEYIPIGYYPANEDRLMIADFFGRTFILFTRFLDNIT